MRAHTKIYRTFIHAILDDTIQIKGLDNKNACIKDLQISTDGKTWIPLTEFLLNNDWDKTIVGERDISKTEQAAVVEYVRDEGPYQNIKGLFDPEYNLVRFDSFDVKLEKEDILEYLKIIINMQSAYNKARIARPHQSTEVYRNIDFIEGEVAGDIKKPGAFVRAESVASTTRDKKPYGTRNIKLVIAQGSDAIPLHDIIKDYALRSLIPKDEQENFLGVRPLFKVKPLPASTAGNKPKQQEYALQHVTKKQIEVVTKMQGVLRQKIKTKKSSPVTPTPKKK